MKVFYNPVYKMCSVIGFSKECVSQMHLSTRIHKKLAPYKSDAGGAKKAARLIWLKSHEKKP